VGKENKEGLPREPGKLADLIVWHDNPYTATTEDIRKLTVDLTMMGGKLVQQV
jgi:predicted amidohydrolase YtcJ